MADVASHQVGGIDLLLQTDVVFHLCNVMDHQEPTVLLPKHNFVLGKLQILCATVPFLTSYL